MSEMWTISSEVRDGRPWFLTPSLREIYRQVSLLQNSGFKHI
jgi:hypothetical protein